MAHKEEFYARDLHRLLTRELAASDDVRVSVEGAGVHWACAASHGDRCCSVSCFATGGAEYLARFQQSDQVKAWGRTHSQPDLVEAILRWLAGAGVNDLHARFAFVDQDERALAGLAADVVRAHPELGRSAEYELRHLMCDLRELWFHVGDRSSRVSYYGKNTFPDAFFLWDGCMQFRFQVDDAGKLGAVLMKWVCDRALPSAMAADFPWLQLEAVARYYEDGKPVEGEFILSWDWIERFYQVEKLPFTAVVLAFLTAARQAGYDRLLRAGQSLWTLVFSRSRRHGLRDDQPSVAIVFRADGMDAHVHIGGRERHSFPALAFTPEVDALLRRLADQPID